MSRWVQRESECCVNRKDKKIRRRSNAEGYTFGRFSFAPGVVEGKKVPSSWKLPMCHQLALKGSLRLVLQPSEWVTDMRRHTLDKGVGVIGNQVDAWIINKVKIQTQLHLRTYHRNDDWSSAGVWAAAGQLQGTKLPSQSPCSVCVKPDRRPFKNKFLTTTTSPSVVE